jgi:23S rRNA (pseudouridine1915-N3)-methyltransferase
LFAPAVEEYAARLSHYADFELVELPSGRSKAAEATAILTKAKPKDWLVALDERGTSLSSMALSQFIGRAQKDARDLMFVVGGDEGLADPVLKAARLVLSLSAMTLPHRLARVVIAEQVYRAFTLLRGEPYHKS